MLALKIFSRTLRADAVFVLVVAFACAAAAPAPARKASPPALTPEAAKSKLIGTWDATPALDENHAEAMAQVRDPDEARMRAIGARLIYTFKPDGVMQVVIVTRQGAPNPVMLNPLKARPLDAKWDVVKGAKGGLVLKVTYLPGNKAFDDPLTFKDDDAMLVGSGMLEQESIRSPFHFRRNIGERIVRWIGANNAVGGEKSPLVADMAKIVSPFVDAGEDFRLQLVAGLIKSGKPTELFAFCEQLFIHELTDADAAKRKLTKMGATSSHWPRDNTFPILSEATANDGPKFDAKGGRIDLRKPITGTVTYAETNRLPPEATYVVRVSMVIGGQKISAFTRSVSPRPGASAWKFSVNPPKDLANYAGPVSVFVDLCRETKFAGPDVVMQVLSPSADARFEAGK